MTLLALELDVGCWMLDVGCWMLDVERWTFSLGSMTADTALAIAPLAAIIPADVGNVLR
jgi:hypothetical protein